MKLTITTKGVHDLAGVLSAAYRDSKVSDPVVASIPLMVPACNNTCPLALGPDFDYRLWEETFIIPTPSAPKDTFAACVAVSTAPVEKAGARSGEKVFKSPESAAGVVLVVAGFGVLGLAAVLWHANTLGDEEKGLGSIRPLDLGFPGDGENRLLFDGGLSLFEEMDHLVEGKIPWARLRFDSDPQPESPTGSEDGEGAREAQKRETVSILRQVEKAISRLERQRAVCIVSAGLDRITKALEADGSDEIAQDTTDESDAAADLRDARQWALVVRRPENLSPVLVYQFVCALHAGWERHTASAVTVPAEEPAQAAEDQTVSDDEDVSAPANGRKKRKRPSKAKRMRQRRQREEFEMNNPGAVVPPQWGPQYSSPAGYASQPYGPGYGQPGGPFPAPAVVAWPPPYDQQYMYYAPGPFYHGSH